MKNYNPRFEEKVVSFSHEKNNPNNIMNLHPIIPFNEADITPNQQEFYENFKYSSLDVENSIPSNIVSPYPIAIDEFSLAEANKLKQTLYRAIHAVVNAYFEDAQIRKIVQLSPRIETLLRYINQKNYVIGSFRPDIIVDGNNKMRVCEINARFPTNGFFLSYGLQQILPTLSYTKSIAPIPSLQAISKAFADFFDKDLPIVILKGREAGMDIYLAANCLKSQGYTVRFASPELLGVAENKLKDPDGFIEQVILELHQDEMESLPDNILTALAEVPRSLNDLRTIFIVHDKRLLSVLGNREIMKKLIDESDVEILQSAIIESFTVSQIPVKVKEEVYANPSNWLLKPSRLGKGEGIKLGKNLSKKEWQDALLEPNHADYVIQHFINPKKYLVVDNKVQSSRAARIVIGLLLCLNERFLGPGVFRISSEEIMIPENRAFAMPALIRDEKRQNYIELIKNAPLDLIYEISAGIPALSEMQQLMTNYKSLNLWKKDKKDITLYTQQLFGNTYASVIKLSDNAREAWRERILMQSAPKYLNSLAMPLAAAVQIPEVALEAILSVVDDPYGPPAALLRNLPIDIPLPPTPLDGGDAPGLGTPVADKVLLGISRVMGQPIGFQGLKDGTLVQTIAPTLGGSDGMSNEGSKERFNFHIESAFSPNRASHLLLLCLRSDHERIAKTELVDAQAAYSALPVRMQRVLREPCFTTMAPESFKEDHEKEVTSDTRPIVTGPENAPEFCFNMQTTRGLTSDAQKAFMALENELLKESRTLSVKLKPGDLLIFDNRRVLHARTPFKSRLDGTDRWLRRLYVAPDLWAARLSNKDSSDSARVFDPVQVPWNQQK
jgi:L-asparagine oxygenase